MATEVWRDVPGYEGHYQVSDFGRVKSLARTVVAHRASGDVVNRYPQRILKPFFGAEIRGGHYRRVNLQRDGRSRSVGVHVLVALAFLQLDPSTRSHVNHSDGDPANNRRTNLEVMTPRGNSLHACRVLGYGRGADNCRAKLTEAQVRRIRKLAVITPTRVLADRYAITTENVRLIVRRLAWKHVP